MRTPQEVAEAIKGIFTDFSHNWIIVIEAVFLFLIIYFVLKILYENNAKKLIPVYVVLIVCTGAVTLFSRHLSSDVFYIFLLLLSLFFLLLFSVEIKRSIWNRGKRVIPASGEAAAKNTAVSARADEYITGIVKAVQALSKSNTGALIVLSNGNLPKEIIDSGVQLNANISNQLIEGIFIPKDPGGGVLPAAHAEGFPQRLRHPPPRRHRRHGSGGRLHHHCFGGNGHRFRRQTRRDQPLCRLGEPAALPQRLLLERILRRREESMKFFTFLGKLFTHNVPLKILALLLAVAAVIVINAV